MTISERIALQSAQRTTAQPDPVEDAIDRIHAPGKRRGLVISASQPDFTPAPAPAVDYYEERSLSVPHGQAVDMTPVGAMPATATWHQALNSFASELVITNDPEDPEQAWIAIQPKSLVAPLILLHRIQYIEHPQTKRPDNHPF
jgi:hypothetical protein